MARPKLPVFPFTPKSTLHLRAGQFWDIPLEDGRHGAGVVVALRAANGLNGARPDSRSFVAGVLTWSGDAPPTTTTLAGSELYRWGDAHILTIADGGGEILGVIDFPLNEIPTRSHRAGGTVWLWVNGEKRRPATDAERETLPSRSTWGYQFARVLAESVNATLMHGATPADLSAPANTIQRGDPT